MEDIHKYLGTKKPKDKQDETVVDTMQRMSQGNPGAVSVLIQIQKKHGSVGVLLVDSLKIYGSDLWVAYKDISKENVTTLMHKMVNHSKILKADIEKIQHG